MSRQNIPHQIKRYKITADLFIPVGVILFMVSMLLLFAPDFVTWVLHSLKEVLP